MARLDSLTFDCRHPASLARFWASVLDGYSVAPYDEEELERLRSMGIDDPEDDPTVLVIPDQAGPRLFFQRVPEGKVAKNRVHLDVAADEGLAEVDRLIALGATMLDRYDEGGHQWVTLADPEGNELCVVL